MANTDFSSTAQMMLDFTRASVKASDRIDDSNRLLRDVAVLDCGIAHTGKTLESDTPLLLDSLAQVSSGVSNALKKFPDPIQEQQFKPLQDKLNTHSALHEELKTRYQNLKGTLQVFTELFKKINASPDVDNFMQTSLVSGATNQQRTHVREFKGQAEKLVTDINSLQDRTAMLYKAVYNKHPDHLPTPGSFGKTAPSGTQGTKTAAIMGRPETGDEQPKLG